MHWFYSLSVYALMAVLFLYFFWRGFKEPDYRKRWAERLGFVAAGSEGSVWVHAASVGEVQAISAFISELLVRAPDAQVLLTTFTPTGSALVRGKIQKQWGSRVRHCYVPLDTGAAVRRFLQRTRPSQCLIVETEIWPNLLLNCRRVGVPVSFVSATVSERSLQRYRSFPANRLIPPVLDDIRHVFAQTAADAERFGQLGVDADRIQVIGNIKFDYQPPANIVADAQDLRQQWHAHERPVWVAASTHEGEEQMVLEAFKRLKTDIHDLLLLLVPRHPQRFKRALKLCHEAHVSVASFARHDHIDDETEVVLGDTIGDLLKFIALADVVFVGGSLVPVGGHNLLEPAAFAKAVISGPYTESQSELRALLEDKSAFLEVRGATALESAVRQLLNQPGLRAQKGAAAQAVVAENQGIVSRCLDILLPE